ncbi:MAG: hypothetical protein B9S32_16300 [Verrucomicrobia bacterium Tous-C9LFEB]|nr:MAG: hypothetical protein B9S32_16300 [Verrucomicrobia bacterium Tous-C9LFEB]
MFLLLFSPVIGSVRGMSTRLGLDWKRLASNSNVALAILTGLNLLHYLDRSVLSSVVVPMKAELGLSDGELGRLWTAFMLGYFVTSPLFGYFGDRYPRRWLIFAGIFFWSLGTVLTGVASLFAFMLAMRVLVGLGEASYATLSPGWIADLYEPARRNNALTIFYTAIPVGSALGYILGGVVSERYGWREAFYFAGAPGLLLAFILLWMHEPTRGEADARAGIEAAQEKPKLRDVLKLSRLGRYHLVVWGYTAYTFALGAFGFWGPAFLNRFHQVPNEKAALFFGAVLVVTGLVGTLVGGFAATAWQRRSTSGYAWLSSLSVLAAVPVSVLAFLSPNTTISMICLALAMFLAFLSTGPVNTLLLESVPVNLRASAVAVSIFATHLFGDFWSTEIVGLLSDSWQSLRAAVMILPGALFVAAILWAVLAKDMGKGAEKRVTLAEV